jgi:hypothetical protein
MERTMKDLLEEYTQADLQKRLHLYLQYPDLRDSFAKRDRIEPPPELFGPKWNPWSSGWTILRSISDLMKKATANTFLHIKGKISANEH